MSAGATWARTRLKYVAGCNATTLPEDTDPEFEFDYVDIGSVTQGSISADLERVKFGNAPSRARRVARPGDTVVSTVRTYLKAVAEVLPVDAPQVFSTGFAVLEPDSAKVVPRFLGYLMQSDALVDRIVAHSTGVSYPAINSSQLMGFAVRLPSLPEQAVIADFLDRETAKIDALIDKQRTLVDRLRERLGAIAELASGGPWELAPLSSCCTLIQTGPFGSQLGSDDYVDDGVPVINPVHLAGGVITPDPATSVPPATADRLARHSLRTGDVVAARRGELGRCAVVPPALAGALCGTGSVLIRPDSQAYDSDYLQLVLSSRRTSEVLQRGSVGSTMPNLNTSMISRLRLPRPPLDEQLEIVRRVKLKTARIWELIGKAEQFIQLALERRSALIGAAVTGQLDVSTGKVA